jgi:uncharacterized protein (TIGR03067 family)
LVLPPGAYFLKISNTCFTSKLSGTAMMRTVCVLTVVSLSIAFAQSALAQTLAPLQAAQQVAPRETDDSLLDKMQGSWEIAQAVFGGKPFPLDAKTVLTIKGREYELTMPGAADKGKLTVDTTAVPYQLTIEGTEGPNKGTKIPCIVKLEKEQLVVCYQLDGGEARPTTFESPDGSSLLLANYQRVKAKASK